MKPISQTQARAYRARVTTLEKFIHDKRHGWTRDWPEGIFVGRVEVGPTVAGIVETARRLKHHVEVTNDGTALTLWADPIPEPKDI